MLNDLLKQQIINHLGERPSINHEWSSLLECINEVYEHYDNYKAHSETKLAEQTALLNEYHHNFLQLSDLFEKVAQKLNYTLAILNNEPEKEFSDMQKPEMSLLKLISNIESHIIDFKVQNGIISKKLHELENINKELEQFAYIVSHDLKAPLRAISNLSQWIEDDISGLLNNQAKENFMLLRSRVFRMESLINAILTYSKSTKSKNENVLSDTGWLLKEVIDSLVCPENITIRVNGKFPVLQTQPIKLQQVFANLISNSIKYNDKETGIIEIGFFETDDHCQFYVLDNGPGIEPQYHKKVFQIFQTLESKDEYENTGIGLAIVKKIIEEKGGKIWIESEKNKGTKFVFLWPKLKNEILQKI